MATSTEASSPPSRRTSISSAGRSPSVPGRSPSGSSSRSTSFNLPAEARADMNIHRPAEGASGEEVGEEEEMDEEGEF